ncbi:MAG TPA: GNAT family N-acetyltransferase [Candidatus Limnocylindrales bacterium]
MNPLALQVKASRALPAEHVKDVDGWRLRYSPGCSWWVSTVQPHGDTDPAGFERAVAAVEAFYAGFGAVARFQLGPGALDDFLKLRGYPQKCLMSLQIAPAEVVAQRAPAGGFGLRVWDRPDRAWFETGIEVHGGGVDPRAEWALLQRVREPSCYAGVLVGGRVVAVGRAVADTGWAGVFGMATLPEARGRGAARAVLGALADWARRRGAGSMYLQVERDNDAALRLYGGAGFTQLCGYHYRVAG